MKKLSFAFLLSLFFLHDCLSQTKVTGIAEGRTAADYSRRFPLSGATISLEGTGLGATADSTGIFFFEIPEGMEGTGEGGDSLVVRYRGFRPVKVAVYFPLYEDVLLQIELLDSTITVSSSQGERLGNAIPPPPPPRPDYSVSTVYYATDRARLNSADPSRRYGVGRSPNLSYGFCRVSIPRDHRMGELEEASFWRMEFRDDPNKHIVVLETKALSRESFLQTLRDSVSKSAEGKAFVFIHGYNVSFADAARRTAQMSYDLGFKGIPVFYSWPSQASVAKYTVDENNIEWTQPHLKQFLVDFLSRSGARKVYIIAHSMGNRAMARTLASIIKEQPQLAAKVSEIILAAPDIDADIFKSQIAPALTAKGHPVTLYASSEDKALALSKKVHGFPRAGESGKGLVIAKGVETIDVTGLDTGFLRHSYIGDSRTVLADVDTIIRRSLRAGKRDKLKAVPRQKGTYWKFKD